MSELIRREDLENWLRTECASIDTYEDKEYVIGRLREDLPTVNQWHRVEVEEPTKAGWYLVMDVDGDFNVDEWHNTFGWQFITPSDAGRITHWMPIEPPKEVQE